MTAPILLLLLLCRHSRGLSFIPHEESFLFNVSTLPASGGGTVQLLATEAGAQVVVVRTPVAVSIMMNGAEQSLPIVANRNRHRYSVSSAALGHFDDARDARPDLVLASADDSGYLQWFRNDGPVNGNRTATDEVEMIGSLSAQTPLISGVPGVSFVLSADVTGDGHDDIVALCDSGVFYFSTAEPRFVHPTARARKLLSSTSTDPSAEPTVLPSLAPTHLPSALPSGEPTALPSATPTRLPSPLPSGGPSAPPSPSPTRSEPSLAPTPPFPTAFPTETPSEAPSPAPTWLRRGNFTRFPVDASAAARPSHAAVVDLDKDGDLDLVVVFVDDDSVRWYENDGEENNGEGADGVRWLPHLLSGEEEGVDGACFVAAKDVDGDGDVDVVVSGRFEDAVVYFENLADVRKIDRSINVNILLHKQVLCTRYS
jgi:hypothetical protein